MQCQGLLIPSEEDNDYRELEQDVFLNAPEFGDLPEEHRRFVIVYLRRSANDTMGQVAERCGISRSRAYELAKDPQICKAMARAAQVISTMSDIKGSAALDIAAEQIYDSVMRGAITPGSWTPTMFNICKSSKDRLGLNPNTVAALRSVTRNPDGSETSTEGVVVTGNVDSALTKLAERHRGTAPVDFEAKLLESVQAVSGSESGAMAGPESGDLPEGS